MEEKKFRYSYSPSRNEEVDRIAAKYTDTAEKHDSDFERLKKLDRQAERPGTFTAIAVGIIGVLVVGAGLSLMLTFDHFIAGLIAGIIGLAIAAAATPVYREVTRHSREKYRDEILSLSEKIKNGGL